MKKDNNVLSGSRKAPLFCAAFFLLILTAMIMTVRTENVYAAASETITGAPTNLTVADLPEGETSLKVSWTPNLTCGIDRNSSFLLEMSTDGQKSWEPADVITFENGAEDINMNSYAKINTTTIDVNYGKTYYFRAVYLDAVAAYGPYSNVAGPVECKEKAKAPETPEDSGSSDDGKTNPADSGSGSGDSGSGGSGSGDTTPSGDSTPSDGSDSGDGGYNYIPYLPQPTAFATKVNAKTAIVSWYNVSDATGYYVYKGKKKIKTVKASAKNVIIKKKGAGKAKYKVVAYAKVNGKTYKSIASKAVKPKANVFKRSISPNVSDYELMTCKFIVKSIKLSGKTYTVTGYAMNNRVYNMPKYKKLSISLNVNGKKAFSKTYKNKKVGVKNGRKKKLVFKIKGKPNMDLANGVLLLSVHGTAVWPKALMNVTHTW